MNVGPLFKRKLVLVWIEVRLNFSHPKWLIFQFLGNFFRSQLIIPTFQSVSDQINIGYLIRAYAYKKGPKLINVGLRLLDSQEY